ncbi:TPA: hypothetical protein QHU55_002559 [Klebsiella aerogenes]|nr:hypothetical protein [Klebsiella aerogenes]
MSAEILMQFLKKGLIDLNGSDEKLDKLMVTTASLVEILDADPSQAICYTLVALDPRVSEDDPVVKGVISVLETNWTTYFNTFAGTPVQVVRAMLLQALVNQSVKNQYVAIAFVSIVRNMLPRMDSGNEIDMWTDLIGSIERRLNKRAEEEWATPEKIKVKPFVYNQTEVIEINSAEVSIDRTALENSIEKATGPVNPKNQATGGNPNWPNSGQAWAQQFSPLITKAIADTLDEALAEVQIESVDLSKPLKELSSAISEHIDSTLNSICNATAGLQRRSSLLWWKESLYSYSASCTYRDMSVVVAAAVMAYDLFKLVPTSSPASVPAFLYETVLSLPDYEKTKQFGISQLIKEVKKTAFAKSLCDYINNTLPKAEGRCLLVALLQSDAVYSNDSEFNKLTGLAAKSKFTLSEWSTWIFRELQAVRAVVHGEDSND